MKLKTNAAEVSRASDGSVADGGQRVTRRSFIYGMTACGCAASVLPLRSLLAASGCVIPDDVLVYVPRRFHDWMQAYVPHHSFAEAIHYLSRLGHECVPFANKVRRFASEQRLDLASPRDQVSLRSFEGICGPFASQLSHLESLGIEKVRESFLESLDRLPQSERRAAAQCTIASHRYPVVPPLPRGVVSCPGDVDVNRYWTSDGGSTGFVGASRELIAIATERPG